VGKVQYFDFGDKNRSEWRAIGTGLTGRGCASGVAAGSLYLDRLAGAPVLYTPSTGEPTFRASASWRPGLPPQRAARGAGAFQMRVEMAERGELAGIDGGAGGAGLAARVEIAAAKQVGRGNHGSAHGAVLVGALRPRDFAIEPKIEAHRPYVIPAAGRTDDRVLSCGITADHRRQDRRRYRRKRSSSLKASRQL